MMFRLKQTLLHCMLAAVCFLTAAACSGVIYEDELGDCNAYYQVQFRYTYNMLSADAFASQVETLTLHLLSPETGEVLYTFTDSGEALAHEGYTLSIDIAPGTYDLLAWAGTETYETWSVLTRTHRTALGVQLPYGLDDEGNAYYSQNIDRLFYGFLENVEFPDAEGTHSATIDLVKNTNEIRIVLQNISGESIQSVDQFNFSITCANGALTWENNLADSIPVTYQPWYTAEATANIEVASSATTYKAAAAEFTLPRLLTGVPATLTVSNSETGNTILSIPFIDYALLIKSLYAGASAYSDQEYLDRQDSYEMVFFLDTAGSWISSYIYINAWKVVLQQSEL